MAINIIVVFGTLIVGLTVGVAVTCRTSLSSR